MHTHHRPLRTFDPPAAAAAAAVAAAAAATDAGDPGGVDPGLQGALVSYASSIGLCTRPLPLLPLPLPLPLPPRAPTLAAMSLRDGGRSTGAAPLVAAAAAAEVSAGPLEEEEEPNFPLPPPLLPLPATNL